MLFLLNRQAGTVILRQTPYPEENQPSVNSDYVYLIDFDNHQVLYAVRADEQMYPASMTKIMSEILFIEHFTDLSQKIQITDAMWVNLIEENASVARFMIGDEPTVQDLLHGVVLPSGADAVQSLAVAGWGSIDAFVEVMNQKADELGMTNTHFANPTGLHDDNHYSTAADIAILLEYALNNPTFREILNTKVYKTGPLASAPEGLTLQSTTWPFINNEDQYFHIPGFLGGKSGFTNPAGRCFASHAEFNGMHLGLVTAHAENLQHLEDAETIYTWYSEHYERRTLAEEGTILKEADVTDTLPHVSLTFTFPETVSMDLPKDAVIEVNTSLPDTLQAPLKKDQTVGTVTITANGFPVYEGTLTSPEDVSYSSLMHAWNAVNAYRAAHPFAFWTILVLAVVFLLLIVRIIHVQIRRRIRRARRAARRRAKQRARSTKAGI